MFDEPLQGQLHECNTIPSTLLYKVVGFAKCASLQATTGVQFPYCTPLSRHQRIHFYRISRALQTTKWSACLSNHHFAASQDPCNLEPEPNVRKQNNVITVKDAPGANSKETYPPPVVSTRCAIHQMKVQLTQSLLPFIKSQHLKGLKGAKVRTWEHWFILRSIQDQLWGTLASREPQTRRPQWDLNLVSPGQPSTSLNWTAPEPNSAPGNRAAEEQAARHSN